VDVLAQIEAAAGPSPITSEWDQFVEKVREEAFVHQLAPTTPLVKIGDFDALDEIGRGGFGIVFKALDPKLDRLVALKVCLTESPRAVQGLVDEAKAIAKLSHANIVPVYALGHYGKRVFFAMQYIDGENAAEFGKRKDRPTWQRIVKVYCGAARGLAAAHKQDIVHGDVKPSNILVGWDDFPRVADFGLARTVIKHSPESEHDELRHRAGTLPYMAPETLRGQLGDARADQWSLCVSIYQTIVGELPFWGETTAKLLDAIQHDGVQLDDPKIPEALRAVLRRGLSIDPSERFPDMDALADALDRLLLPTSAPPPPDEPELDGDKPAVDPETPALTPVGGSGPARENSVRRGTFGVALLLVGVAVGWTWRPSVEVREATEPEPILPTSPCAVGEDSGSSVEIDPVVLDVCEQIRNGELDDADDAWDREYDKRRKTTAADKLAADTMIIARTFFDQAEVITRSEQFRHDGRTLTATEQQALARKAADNATIWLEVALNPPPELGGTGASD
jgi:serine/threonine protein kinase